MFLCLPKIYTISEVNFGDECTNNTQNGVEYFLLDIKSKKKEPRSMLLSMLLFKESKARFDLKVRKI